MRGAAVLVNASAEVVGIPALHYVMPISDDYPIYSGHSFWTRRDNGMPLAHDTGFGTRYLYSGTAPGHPIPDSIFVLASGCNAPCNYADLTEPLPSLAPKALNACAHFPKLPHCPGSWPLQGRRLEFDNAERAPSSQREIYSACPHMKMLR